MNILFVGSGDITANYLADRLYREGHQISWVTKDEKSFLLNKDFKGKIYREGYQVNTLKSILRLQGIDTVVFAYESYVGDPWEEKTESLIPALIIYDPEEENSVKLHGKPGRHSGIHEKKL